MPADVSQSSWRVLLVEDEFLIAEDLASASSAAGATLIGPAYTVEAALRLIESGGALDGAILDVNLKGEAAFPLPTRFLVTASRMCSRQATIRQYLKRQYEGVLRFEKPIDPAKLVAVRLQAKHRQ
jgi:DNA-binding response OmpR family regulator